MSYILDALRKSEQERLRGKLPDLKNFGDEDQRAGGQHRLAWIIGGALLALNAAGIGIWLLRSPDAASDGKEAAVVTATNNAASTAAKPATAPAATATTPGVATTPAGSVTTATTPAPAGSVPATTGAPVAVNSGVAGAVQQGVPVVTAAPGTVVTTAPPPGTVYYVAPGGVVPGQQIVVVPGGVVPNSVVQGGMVQGGVVQGGVQGTGIPTVNQPVPQSWDNASTAVPPPPAPPPPPPVNLDQTLDAAGVGTTPQISYLPQMDELPPQIRSQIPDMAFSSHMFSSMSKFRSVVINGNRVKEGQQVGNITVQEITETGVILSLGDTRFQVDVLGKWSQ